MDLVAWYNQKTTRLLLVGILGAIGGFIGDQISLKELVETIFLLLTGIFLRQGVEKSKVPAQPEVTDATKPT